MRDEKDIAHEKGADAANIPAALLHLSKTITVSLHRKFEQAAERLNRVRMAKAEAQGFVESERILQRRISEHRNATVWWENNAAANDTSVLAAEFWNALLEHESKLNS